MIESIDKILIYCKDLKSLEDFKSDSKTVDACIRNFQVLGEASNKVPFEVRKDYPEIPWKEIKGMRNILVHEYFGVSSKIIWNTVKSELPKISSKLKDIRLRFDSPAHPWRICPPGEYFVSESSVDEHLRKGANVKQHLRKAHCREYQNNPSANILTAQEIKLIHTLFIKDNPQYKTKLRDLGFGAKGAQYDSLIQGWTEYWNNIFTNSEPLEADLVKALLGSESSFNPESGKNLRNSAKGIGQLMPLTIKALQGYKNELKDHLIEIESSDALNAEVGIASAIRWLHQKKFMASRKLKRNASWIEAIEAYKNVLGKQQTAPKTYNKNMKQFLEVYKKK